MAGFCTNLDLFVKLRSGGDLKNHMFLYESIISVLTTEVSEEDKNRIKEFCRLFCVNLNKKWIESCRHQKTFMNRESNRKWLEKNIKWPVCDSVDLRSEMGFSDAALSEPVDIDSHVPTLAVCTEEAGTSTEKEHRKPFEDLSNKQKKRRSTSIVEENSEEELQHWYITKLKDNGKTNLAKVVEYLSNNPDALSEVDERLFKKQSLSTVSEDKCLALYTSLALSKWKYLALRQFLKEENCAAFPSYPNLVNAKKRCYPPQESMEITEKGAHIKLQALLDHTVKRILLDMNSVDRSQNEELKLTWKWGLDGSSSQSNYKQKTSNTATEFDDSSVVMISIVPLRLVSTSPSSGNENIVWENPTPCSTLYCRPVKFTFTSETADFIKSEESEMKKQIDERISTQFGNIIVSHELHMTMIDGKVANIIAEVPSFATCPICLAKPSEMNNLDALASKPLREEIYKQGISSLHMKIRCMECLLHISYNLDFQRWTARGEHKALKQAKKNTTQQEFREQTGMLIDIVKQGSPHGSVMSCQSLAARAFSEPDKDMTHCSGFHRSVRFSSDSRSSTRTSNDPETKRETPGSISLTALTVTPVTSQGSAMSQSAPSASATYDVDDTFICFQPVPPVPSCRFPKLEECAHFHYERVSLGGLSIETVRCEDKCQDSMEEGWICLKVRSHVNSACDESAESRALSSSWTEASDVREWTLTRNRDNLLQLDDMLHRCIYDRKVSGLPNLREKIPPALNRSESEYQRLISDYVHHLSIIADDSINCGPVLNWLQMDNKGHKLLVANEDSSSINTPAVAAAYSVRKYVSQARDEISFEVGDMISIIDMPALSGPAESLWWRGKRGFRVGFFPHHCVAVIGDKVPRHMTQPPPIVGSVAVAPIKPVLRKHGKLISLFRSFILSRPSRRSLKQQGILRERVFGCDLGEHLLNCGHEVPQVLVECAAAIEARGPVDGVYRLSGGAGLTQRLRAAFDAGDAPDLSAPATMRDPHAVPSLLKMYFRELPNPLCTYQLYESFVSAVQQGDEAARLRAVRDTVVKLPPPHYRTLAYLMRHLRRVSLLGEQTGMTARNMAIVWAPNLLRAPRPQHALQGVAVQAVVTEFLICYAEELFAQEQGEDSGPESLEQERCESQVELRGNESCRRPKSLPINPPTKLLSLEEARRRGQPGGAPAHSPRLPAASGAIAAAAAANTQLRPSSHLRPKYIEVGSGPNNLPQYHTVLDLPAPGKRGLKRSPSGWRGLFTRSKQQRARTRGDPAPHVPRTPTPPLDIPMCTTSLGLRPVKSCESLASDSDTLAPLTERAAIPLKHHTRSRSSFDVWQESAMLPATVAQLLSPCEKVDLRSSSCDSYFEPWQAELADMRLRLSPQERDHHMFSEEDDTQLQINHKPGDSLCSTPPESVLCSAEPSPRRNLRVDIHQANELAERRRLALEEQLSQIGYIDGESPRARPPPEKRHSARPASPRHTDIAKRLCKDRDSPMTSLTDFPTSLGNVKLRERNSPRKSKTRYSGMHLDTDKSTNRLSWHGKDGHSTLIKIDWPNENSVSTLTTSTMNSSPLTPITPIYDPLESDSEVSDTNKHTIQIKSEVCSNCDQEKCLKCELKATDYENLKDFAENLHDSLEHSPLHSTDISYHNLNRLSAVSNSSNSETDKKKDDNDVMKVMTSSHESSSSYSNVSLTKGDELYECYNYTRPNYINLQSSSTSKSSPGSPLKSPLKSTISITFRSPTKCKNYEDTPTNDRDSVYEDIDLEKNLSIVEDASIPQTDACLPTQQACQPDDIQDLIILETPTETNLDDDIDVYSQVKFFKKSVNEVNAMLLPEDRHYENIAFEKQNDYENINVDTLKICDKDLINEDDNSKNAAENGNFKSMNVRELAIRFESPTEQKAAFTFDKFKAEIKYPSLERKDEKRVIEIKKIDFKTPTVSPKSYRLSKNSHNARSLDENAFIKEFGNDQSNVDRRKSLEVKTSSKKLPDLNLNTDHEHKVIITPTSENKISLIQRFDRPDIKNLISVDCDKKLSRERIEKYKEERRNFLREKYSSQSFRSNPEQLTRIKIRKDREDKIETCERLKDEMPKFERRNTVDLGQRLRFSLAKSSNNLESIPSPSSPEREFRDERNFDRKEKVSPSYNIRDMTAIFEQKSHPNTG